MFTSGTALDDAAAPGAMVDFGRRSNAIDMSDMGRMDAALAKLDAGDWQGGFDYILAARLADKRGQVCGTWAHRPLHWALWSNLEKAVEPLIAFGENVHAKNDIGQNALHVAAIMGHARACASLVRAGLSIEEKCKSEKTALHYACEDVKFDVVMALTELGADIHARGDEGASPLHCAAYGGDINIVNWLLLHGADPDVLDDHQKSAADYADTGLSPHIAEGIRAFVSARKAREAIDLIDRPMSSRRGVS